MSEQMDRPDKEKIAQALYDEAPMYSPIDWQHLHEARKDDFRNYASKLLALIPDTATIIKEAAEALSDKHQREVEEAIFEAEKRQGEYWSKMVVESVEEAKRKEQR